jgi:hypothetical protein
MTQTLPTPVSTAESERLAALRAYYETGCLCLRSRAMTRLGSVRADGDALDYYETHCACSRSTANRT